MVVVGVALVVPALVAAEAAAAMVLELAVASLVLAVAVVEVGVEVVVWAGREAETGAGYTQTDGLLAAVGNAVERYSAMPLPRRSRFHCPVSIHQ